jgi:TatD DNase family protein
MSISLVDYHCHLDLYPDFEAIIEECENNKVHTLGVTTTPKAFPRNYELTSNKQYVKSALGLHPQLISERSNEIESWKEFFHKTRFIGEIGLDAGVKFYKTLELQKEVFRTILDFCSNQGDKILSIHSVRTVPIVLEMLEKSEVLRKNKVVLHWYSGDSSNLQKAILLGCYFSINSEMLKNERSRFLIEQIPLNKLLTETDGPFTLINNLPARPVKMYNTIDKIAILLKLEKDFIIERVFQNLNDIEG